MIKENIQEWRAQHKLIYPENFFAPVWHLLGPEVWLAGGAVVRWLEGESFNGADFDLYSTDPMQLFNSMGRPLVKESQYAITVMQGLAKVQILKHPYSNLEAVFDSFDFSPRTVGTDGTSLVFGDGTMDDLIVKRMRFIRQMEEGPVTSLEGMIRYANRGYTLTHAEATKALKAWGVPESKLTLIERS